MRYVKQAWWQNGWAQKAQEDRSWDEIITDVLSFHGRETLSKYVETFT
jgi:hypothetical protein